MRLTKACLVREQRILDVLRRATCEAGTQGTDVLRLPHLQPLVQRRNFLGRAYSTSW